MIYAKEGWQSDDRATPSVRFEKMKESRTMLLLHADSARVLDELIARAITRPELMKKHTVRDCIR